MQHSRKAVGPKGEQGRDESFSGFPYLTLRLQICIFPICPLNSSYAQPKLKYDPRTFSTSGPLPGGCEVEERPGMVLFCLWPVLYPAACFAPSTEHLGGYKRLERHMQKKGTCSLKFASFTRVQSLPSCWGLQLCLGLQRQPPLATWFVFPLDLSIDLCSLLESWA